MQNVIMKKLLGFLWFHAQSLNQNEQHPLQEKKVRIPEQNTKTQGADIRSLFRRILKQNSEQNRELQGEIDPEEDNIIAVD